MIVVSRVFLLLVLVLELDPDPNAGSSLGSPNPLGAVPPDLDIVKGDKFTSSISYIVD